MLWLQVPELQPGDILLADVLSEHGVLLKTILEEVYHGRPMFLQEIYELAAPMVQYIHGSVFIPIQLAKVREVDQYTFKHSVNVGVLSAAIGKWLQLPLEQTLDLAVAGFLHDVGKMRVPLEILNKPGALSFEEMQIMKLHANYGYELIRDVHDLPSTIAPTALYHHERMDGSGYPHGLKGYEIPFFARILMIADIFDAMTSRRVYRNNLSPFKAFETIHAASFSSLDPHIAQTFLHYMTQSYIGTKVVLSNGVHGEVAFIPADNPGYPIILTGNGLLNLADNECTIEELASN